MSSLELISQHSGVSMIAQSKLVLHEVVFVATSRCLTTLEKEIHCKLRKTCYPSQLRAATCNGFKISMQSLKKVEPNSTLCNCCKPEKVTRQVAKRTCYTLQINLHRVLQDVEISSLFSTDCRDFFETIASCSRT